VTTSDAKEVPLLFEASWEVCAQAGGIYTVLRTKCAAGMERCGDDYYLLGPYREAAARIEFEPEPAAAPVDAAVEALRARGIVLHTGRWVITGHPRVVLVDIRSVSPSLREMKYHLWNDLGISTPNHDVESDEVISFGHVVADFLGELRARVQGRAILAQFHEWQGGIAIPLIRQRGLPIPTVFTTHATLVGRSLSAANRDIYASLHSIHAEAVAFEHGVGHRFQMERAAAQAADVFTTVSEITAQEAEHFLGRKPDVVLPNGLNVQRFTAPHEFQNLHQQYKSQIHEFVMGHFFPSYSFSLARTLYVFNAGRYEYRNKGMDVFIDSLAELNHRLKAERADVTVVGFIIAPAAFRQLNVETLNRQAMFTEFRSLCHELEEQMGRRLFQTVMDGRLPTTEDLFAEYDRVRLWRMLHAWRQDALPTIVTHDLTDDVGDAVLTHLRRVKLFNAEDDPVKVVFHPQFINATSPTFSMEYDHFVRGCNLGVFASYYEPWGYTPMECIVRGVPAITSDLSGFGLFLMENFPDHDANGMFVCRRREVNYRSIVYQVTGWMHALTKMTQRERIAQRNRVEGHADHFDWSKMIRHYQVARSMALRKHPA
jgi:glycogen(starch) synthase